MCLDDAGADVRACAEHICVPPVSRCRRCSWRRTSGQAFACPCGAQSEATHLRLPPVIRALCDVANDRIAPRPRRRTSTPSPLPRGPDARLPHARWRTWTLTRVPSSLAGVARPRSAPGVRNRFLATAKLTHVLTCPRIRNRIPCTRAREWEEFWAPGGARGEALDQARLRQNRCVLEALGFAAACANAACTCWAC